MVNVIAQYKGKKYTVDVDAAEPLDLFKAQLFELTNVPVERQKLIIKGKQLKTDETFAASVKEGVKIMVMGSAATVAAAKEKVVFEEDLTDSQKAVMVETVGPPGLANLGNTCYMNSSLQCLKAIPSLVDGLQDYALRPASYGSTKDSPNYAISKSLGDLMKSMTTSTSSFAPHAFMNQFKRQFPQFAQTSPQGVPMQQDAEESLSTLLFAMLNEVKNGDKLPGGLRRLFEGSMVSRLTNTENPEEVEEEKSEEFMKLRCHITIETNHLQDGIKSGLVEKIEKRSQSTGANAVFEKRAQISSLPPYLITQFMRFYWRTDTQKKAKILRRVVFPMRYDVSELCTPDLQKKIRTYRDEVDAAVEKAKEERDRNDAMEVEQEGKTSLEQRDPQKLNHSGVFELFALITHQGRNADSGHYIGWVKNDAKKDSWFKFDDDVVTEVKEEDIKNLFGGGDWHMAYMCFYRAAMWRPE